MEAVTTLARARLSRALAAAQAEWLGRPVTWGEDDCALACANVLCAALGSDPAARWRGRYATALGYRLVLKRDGFADLEEALEAVVAQFGWPEIAAAAAQAGDLGVGPHARGTTCFLALGGGWWLARADKGFAVRPSAIIARAWQTVS